MRTLAVVFLLTSLACTGKAPESPDSEGAADESESDTVPSDTSTSESTQTEETEETVETEETGEMVDCTLLDEAECGSTAGCTPVWGTPISADHTCKEAGRFAACTTNENCSDAEIGYRDPEDICWWFFADCIYGTPGWEASSEQCPDYESFHMLPDCE